MKRALTLYETTIGKKVAMAASGIILLGYTVGHLYGNLKVYWGPQEFNEYAAGLRDLPALLWGTRLALLFAFSVHILSAFQLWQRNSGARPTRYAKKVDLASNYAAKTMYITGPILLLYVVFHLAHLTFGGELFKDSPLFGIEGYQFNRHNPYNNLVGGFQHWPVVIPYVLGVLALGSHLFHGIWSLFQSIGANHTKYNQLRRDLAIALATFLTVGNLSIPIAVMAGYLEPTTLHFHFPQLE